MTESTKNSGEKLSVTHTKTLTLKRGGVEQGVVRQSFSHGRSKAVVVEKVKRRITGPGEAKPEAPAAAPEPRAAEGPLQEALDLIMATVDALIEERGEDEPVWGSMVKQTLKRRKPGFNERSYGFGSFNELLEEARTRGYLELERDTKSGGYLVRPGAQA